MTTETQGQTETAPGVGSSRFVGRRFLRADKKLFATVIEQSRDNNFVILQTAKGERLHRSIESLLANWIEEDEPSNDEVRHE